MNPDPDKTTRTQRHREELEAAAYWITHPWLIPALIRAIRNN